MTPGSIIVAITDDPEQKKCNVVTGERIKELTVRMDNSFRNFASMAGKTK